MKKMKKKESTENLGKETQPANEDTEKLKIESLTQELQIAYKEIEKLKKEKKELNQIKSINDVLIIENERLREKALPSILIVDDDTDIRRIIKIYLERDYYILEASNSTEAIKILSERSEKKEGSKPVDLIILDIMMPGMDGYQFCKLIKNRHSYQNIPVVMCTAKNTRDDLEKAIKVKVDDYLLKPFSREYLLEKVEKWIKGIK